MAAKRALIVDDSRSARLILERILIRHSIDVDNAESAEAAISYLATIRPDVIFMDHMMPGMDGLQAVRAIKGNPRTASIPIMMYTSQAGDAYLSQARALGAVGVLPKQIRPADVSKVLQQLHLIDDRSQDVEILHETAGPLLQYEPPPPTRDLPLREHFAELRRALAVNADNQLDRLGAELRAVLLETRAGAASPMGTPVPWHYWAIGGAVAACAVVLGTIWLSTMTQLSTQLSAVQGELAQLASNQAQAPAALSAGAAPELSAPRGSLNAVPPADLRPLNLPVPFGADVMGGGRLDSIRQFLYRLVRDGVTGVVDIKSYPGRYCLLGTAADGFALAPDDLPYAKCDVVGNPMDDALSQEHMPLALANLVGEVRHATRGALDVQVTSGDASVILVPYPVVGSDLTAGEWNHAGSSNNRVEVRLR